MLIAYYDILPVPDAHADADNFHEIAANSLKGGENHTTGYTLLLAAIYSITDSSRLFAQFLNVFMGMLAIVYVRRILCRLDISDSTSKRILLIMSVMPFLNIYSAVLLREAWIFLFVTISLYHFVCWYLSEKQWLRHIMIALTCVILAMWMHAGIIGLMIGYVLAFVTYSRATNKVKITKSSYVAFMFVGIFALVLFLNADVFFSKLMTDDVAETIAKRGEGTGGDSDYLTWVDLSNTQMIVFYAPLKMFYMLFSPMIMDWRGFNDIAVFLFDSSFYFIAFCYIMFHKVHNSRFVLLKKYILLSILSLTLLFSMGTSNTGTAIRHRAKMCSVIFVAWALSSQPVSHRGRTKILLNNNDRLNK